MQDKPPFIASQQILLLDPARTDPRRLLSPDVFRQTRFHQAGGEAKEPDGQSPWRPVSHEALFLDASPRRLCLTTDAGIGKTTTMLWAEQQIARQHPDRLAIYVQLRDLPAQADQYTATLAELALIRSGHDLDRTTVQQIIENLLRSGRLVLLVDALDQTLSDTSADAKLRVLARFLQLEARNCPVAVAGRPYAIDRYWDTLFACRAGTTTPFHYGDSLSSEQANFDGDYPYGKAAKGPYLERTAPVGSYQPNAWGLFDMHGNVWEWCDSWFSDTPEQSDQPGSIGSARVLRGGSWDYDGDLCRSACRNISRPTLSSSDIGFRVARARKT